MREGFGRRLEDDRGRVIENLRISVTDRCNLRCRYCLPPDSIEWLPSADLLRFEEIACLVEVFAEAGIRKLRITGGEPLMRRGLHRLIRMLKGIGGIEDVAMTTNGVFLRRHLADLEQAGLDRINVSLDTLDPGTFRRLTFRDSWEEIMAGLAALSKSTIGPIKVNAVIIRGVNDGEILDLARLAVDRAFHVRFIEYMPIGADEWEQSRMLSGEEIRRRIEQEIPLQRKRSTRPEPAVTYVVPGAKGTIGFINSVTEPFCRSCNRIRITSDGFLRTCLFSVEETDLRTPLRNGADRETLLKIIREAVARKEAGHLINDPSFVKPKRTMSQIGG